MLYFFLHFNFFFFHGWCECEKYRGENMWNSLLKCLKIHEFWSQLANFNHFVPFNKIPNYPHWGVSRVLVWPVKMFHSRQKDFFLLLFYNPTLPESKLKMDYAIPSLHKKLNLVRCKKYIYTHSCLLLIKTIRTNSFE